VVGSAENFTEVFLGDGNVNPVTTVKTLKEAGFNGFIIDDHVPHMVEDTGWGHRGRAWSTGYIKALIDAVNTLA
jgi:mannonate dehydratase